MKVAKNKSIFGKMVAENFHLKQNICHYSTQSDKVIPNIEMS